MIKVVFVLFLAALITTAGLTRKRWEGQPPEVAVTGEPVPSINIRDAGTGLKHVTIRLKQNNQETVLVDEALNNDAAKAYDVSKLAKIQEGAATLSVVATDSSLRNFLRGNETTVT